jgi:KDO2-lipid IV(A) lauroyltransferase
VSQVRTPLHRFCGPRYWAIWIALGLLRLLILIPYRMQLALGRGIGRVAIRLMDSRRHNALCNVTICMPALDSSARAALVREHFESLGIALFETAMAWWKSADFLHRMVQIEGAGHLDAARRHGKGVLLLPTHCTTMELGGAFLHRFAVPDIVYQRFSNPLLEELMCRYRSRGGARLIESTRPRAVIRALRSNGLVWYPPDQTYPPKNRVLAPFCGVPAMTNTTPWRIVRLTGARVLPYFVVRLADGSGYRAAIGPALDDFAAGDTLRDAVRLNQLAEQQIRMAPAQYLWIHRRFRASGPDSPDYYAK